jgi:hypothetical protein
VHHLVLRDLELNTGEDDGTAVYHTLGCWFGVAFDFVGDELVEGIFVSVHTTACVVPRTVIRLRYDATDNAGFRFVYVNYILVPSFYI